MTNFTDAIDDYHSRGWVTHPLALDSQGFPKRPITENWPNLTINSTPNWTHAKGLGIVLGVNSGNLAVIDIDDEQMADEVYAEMVSGRVFTRMVRTVRNRLHVYFVESHASASTATTVKWHGRDIKIELKASGTQVAAPPTPGYRVIQDSEPMIVPDIQNAWDSIARKLGIAYESRSSAYPRPWQDRVTIGDRNNAIYIEACALRKGEMPLEKALRNIRIRVEEDYESGELSWAEIERTVRSAYKGIAPPGKAIYMGGWEQ